jgi:hypothetical protein
MIGGREGKFKKRSANEGTELKGTEETDDGRRENGRPTDKNADFTDHDGFRRSRKPFSNAVTICVDLRKSA